MYYKIDLSFGQSYGLTWNKCRPELSKYIDEFIVYLPEPK